LEVQDRQIDVAITQEETLGVFTVKFGYFSQAEYFFVKLGGLLRILGGDGYMLYLRHVVPPL
jgi:hypothetical protein